MRSGRERSGRLPRCALWTEGSARATGFGGREAPRPRQLADLTDPRTATPSKRTDPDRIGAIRVLATVVGGDPDPRPGRPHPHRTLRSPSLPAAGPPSRRERVRTPSKPDLKDIRRLLTAAFSGTALEWYDCFLYGTAAALVFTQAVLPRAGSGAAVGTIASFVTFAVGFVWPGPSAPRSSATSVTATACKVSLIITVVMMGATTGRIGSCCPRTTHHRHLGARTAVRPALPPGHIGGRRMVGRDAAHLWNTRPRRSTAATRPSPNSARPSARCCPAAPSHWSARCPTTPSTRGAGACRSSSHSRCSASRLYPRMHIEESPVFRKMLDDAERNRGRSPHRSSRRSGAPGAA